MSIKTFKHGTKFENLLTIDSAKSLKGKKIKFTYPVYEGNYQTVTEAVVGDIKLAHMTWTNNDPEHHKKRAKQFPREYFDKLVLNDEKGQRIGFTYADDGVFYGSDEDRIITYEEL